MPGSRATAFSNGPDRRRGVLLHHVLHVAELVLGLGVLGIQLDGLLQRREGGSRVAAGDLRLAEPELRHRRLGVLPDETRQVLDCEVDLALSDVLQRPRDLHLDHQLTAPPRRFRRHGRGEVRLAERLAGAVERDEDARQLLVGLDDAGVDRLAQQGLRLGGAARLAQHAREADQGHERVRLGGERLAVGGLGGGHVALRDERAAERALGGGATARGDGLLRQRDGLASRALLSAAVRHRDRRPDALGIAATAAASAGRGRRHAARDLQHGHAPERLALGRAGQLLPATLYASIARSSSP